MLYKRFIISALLFLLGISLCVLSIGCEDRNKTNEMKQTPIGSLEFNNIGHITVNKEDSVYEVRDREELKALLSILKNSHVEYIKFGSKDFFTIYSINGKEIIEASFKGNRYKINGVVYKTKQNIF